MSGAASERRDDGRRLDLRTLPDDGRWEPLQAGALALAADEALEVDDARDLRGLLRRLEQAQPGAFDAVFLSCRPPRFRLELRRRRPGEAPLVGAALAREHARLGRMLAEVAREAADGAFEDAAARFEVFRCGLARHMLVEEHVVLPVFEQLDGSSHDAGVAMKQDHLVLRRAFEAMAEALRRHEGEHFAASHAAFVEVWTDHNLREERGLFPVVDAGRDEAGRAALLGQMLCF